MNDNEELFSFEPIKEAEKPTAEELALLKDQEAEEARLAELQRKQRKDSIGTLGFDVQETTCPRCHARNSMIIVEKGERPRLLSLVSLLLPRLGNCGATLHCFSCGRDIRLPALKEELLIPVLVLLFIVLLVAGDLWLMGYLCNYGN